MHLHRLATGLADPLTNVLAADGCQEPYLQQPHAARLTHLQSCAADCRLSQCQLCCAPAQLARFLGVSDVEHPQASHQLYLHTHW